jgi:hypothetical protein
VIDPSAALTAALVDIVYNSWLCDVVERYAWGSEIECVVDNGRLFCGVLINA